MDSIAPGICGLGFSPLSRADVSEFVLKQVGDNTYVHEMPMISN